MPVPASISDLSTTPASNSPAGSESPSTADDYLRTHAAFIRQLSNGLVGTPIVPVSALNVDCSLGNYFTKTINANSTFTFSNAPSAVSFGFMLELTQTAGAVTWPTSVVWPNNAAPLIQTGKVHIFFFLTDDGGTVWRGASLINYPL